jgi:4-hydroxy-3-polyprenylbenzoate decarboxylase
MVSLFFALLLFESGQLSAITYKNLKPLTSNYNLIPKTQKDKIEYQKKHLNQLEQINEEAKQSFDDDIAASVASGSFKTDAMIILPCSMNTLAKISCGISDNLTTRAASVMIKEQRKLILAPRELPFSPIALENMLKLSKLSIIIAPPIMGYYCEPKDLGQMEDFLIGKWFDLLDIKHDLYKRWGE